MVGDALRHPPDPLGGLSAGAAGGPQLKKVDSPEAKFWAKVSLFPYGYPLVPGIFVGKVSLSPIGLA